MKLIISILIITLITSCSSVGRFGAGVDITFDPRTIGMQIDDTIMQKNLSARLALTEKKYSLIGYKGKQVRDNIHSYDLINCFWEFFKKPKNGVVYNIGGGRYSNCSIIEALNLVEKISKIKIRRKILKAPRVGDHIWYISDTSKFKKHYPRWKQRYNTKKIIEELIEHQK